MTQRTKGWLWMSDPVLLTLIWAILYHSCFGTPPCHCHFSSLGATEVQMPLGKVIH